MVLRKIAKIDEEKCDGCGLCIPNCHESALQIIDGKARLVSDLFCDGLGNCLGHCPRGAITIEEREAEKYDEKKVIDLIIPKGVNTLKAHLEHLRNHDATKYLNTALKYLNEKGIDNPMAEREVKTSCGCLGSRNVSFADKKNSKSNENIESQLMQWPIQMHLISPNAPHFENSDLLLAADCTSYAFGGFQNILKRKTLAIACPKLDSNKDIYVEKLVSLIDDAKIKTITVIIMEVMCCGGLLAIAEEAQKIAKRKIPINVKIISVDGKIIIEKTV